MSTSPRVVDCPDLCWPFSGEPYVPTGEAYHGREYVDPFPCYAHDVTIVKQTLRHVESRVSVVCQPTVYILHYEPRERTNGWAMTTARYPKDEEHPWDGKIVLAGKRIPPHPAVTRYLVAHEYGHHVEYELLRRRGLEQHKTDVVDEYREVRELDQQPYYGGRTWHACANELLANDFRILIGEVEPGYWPHPGIKHPAATKAIERKLRAWWATQLATPGCGPAEGSGAS